MTNEQIQALAREYAEENPKIAELKVPYIRKYEKTCEDFLRFLLRRYCLVEKSKIKETWKDITYLYLAHRHITYDGARYLFDEVLFPEIGKEVEG